MGCAWLAVLLVLLGVVGLGQTLRLGGGLLRPRALAIKRHLQAGQLLGRFLRPLACSNTRDGDAETPRSPATSFRNQIKNGLLRTVSAVATAGAPLLLSVPSRATNLPYESAETVRIPLEARDGYHSLNFTIDAAQGPFRAAVDTGSPFLLVPSVCSTEWGCPHLPESGLLSARPPSSWLYKDADLPSAALETVESFGGQEYDTAWKRGDLKFVGAEVIGAGALSSSRRTTFRNVVFGSVGADVLRRPGGVFLGLVKYKAQDIKPTLLGQLGYNSFCFDPRPSSGALTLSRLPMLSRERDAIPLVDLLPFGAPVRHYAARVAQLHINGQAIKHGQNMFCIVDTGTTGCVLSDDIVFNEYTPTPARDIRITLKTERGNTVELSASASGERSKAFVPVSAAFIPWRGFRRTGVSKADPYADSGRPFLAGPSLVVLGLSFLRGRSLTIDIEAGRMVVGDKEEYS